MEERPAACAARDGEARRALYMTGGGDVVVGVSKILNSSLLAVSKRIFATRYSLELGSN